ncbi:hypothetical protein [Legionella worsleiensis]|uniref:Uncharacterized protein n=1 Tax=Legionella worsleiensis TaxID=45076 RepID=A0A0W1A662_9GAMM|nr:hypothetical protein [Legionella worsleiensis]KTD76855.1 hypothetical protein Lwor_2080 [Legionella worsleiensis]STY33476.1 SidC homolog [Legionella worsleiensis]
MRTKAETIFKIYPSFLVLRSTLTDIAKMTYENITAFEYAVLVKDSYFVRKVVDFLETYKGEDKSEIVTNILEQFDRCFSNGRLAVVHGFLEASNAWCADFPNRTLEERVHHLVEDVGEAQAKFPAHILQEYCHPIRAFDPIPKFSEAELPESLNFYNWNCLQTTSILVSSPGVSGDFALLRGEKEDAQVGWPMPDRDRRARRSLVIDCAALDALDKARTADLLDLRVRLVSIQTADDFLELNTPIPLCSS